MISVKSPSNVLEAKPLEIVKLVSDRQPTAEATRDQGQRDQGQDVVWGLAQNPKSLPPKYFYDDRGSDLFEKICELPE